ncbi:MAG: hypothetical protein ACREYF_06015, partial [Gammaproteobacteria bacterium]
SSLVVAVRQHKAELLRLLATNEPFFGLPPELEALIDRVATFHGFTPVERAEAKEIAAGDIPSAINCFRTLVAELAVGARTVKGLMS